MASTFTPNIQLEEPARGDDSGTWDTPVNGNMTLIDLVSGAQAVISAAAGSVVLAAAQFQSHRLTFNSTLIASITVTFPTSFTKSYDIFHSATGSSAFTITLQTTAGGNVVCASPGECIEVFNTGTSLRYKSLGRIGTYMDYAGSSVPNWVTGCTVAPYLNCDGTTFSSATFPQLAVVLGSTTLPDSKGRFRATLDQGATRLTSAVIGFSPTTVGAAGSSQSQTLVTTNLPAYTPSGSVSIVNGTFIARSDGVGAVAAGSDQAAITNIVNQSASFTGNAQGGTSSGFSVLPPTYMGGLTLIRAG